MKKATVVTAANALCKALNRLKPAQGRVARRNARAALSVAVRAVWYVVDRDYPAIKPRRKRHVRSGLTPRHRFEKRLRALYKRDYEEARTVEIVEACAQVGIRCVAPGRGILHTPHSIWVPKWAQAIGPNVPELRTAKKGHTERKLALARAALKADPPTT